MTILYGNEAVPCSNHRGFEDIDEIYGRRNCWK